MINNKQATSSRQETITRLGLRQKRASLKFDRSEVMVQATKMIVNVQDKETHRLL